MTNNNMIQANALEANDRVRDSEGTIVIISRVRMIDHLRVRIDTKGGNARIAQNDELFELLT